MITATKNQMEQIRKFFEEKGLKIKSIKIDKGDEEYPNPFIAIYVKGITSKMAANLTEDILREVKDIDILVIPAR